MDREYNLFQAKKGAKILHMSQGNGIILEVSFVPSPRIRKSNIIYILDNLLVKGIQARGNKVSSKSVQSVKLITNREIESVTTVEKFRPSQKPFATEDTGN